MQQTGTGIKQVGRVIIPVSDQARARAFYTETLGFEVRSEFVMSPESTWLEVAPLGAVTTMAIVPPPEGKPVGVETRIGFATPDVDADHAGLKARRRRRRRGSCGWAIRCRRCSSSATRMATRCSSPRPDRHDPARSRCIRAHSVPKSSGVRPQSGRFLGLTQNLRRAETHGTYQVTANGRTARLGRLAATMTDPLDSTQLTPAERALTDEIAGRRDEIVALACDLIRFDTQSREEPTSPARQDAALQAYLGERLRASGADVDIWEPVPPRWRTTR